MAGEIVVLVTVESHEEGEKIADHLVAERLAACVNILGPIRSVYRWEGAVRRDTEHLLIIKSTRRCYADLEARVRQLHSYQIPEVIALSIDVGSATYLSWLRASTS